MYHFLVNMNGAFNLFHFYLYFYLHSLNSYNSTYLLSTYFCFFSNSGPVFTKLFRIRIKIRLKLKILFLCTFFETYYNYLNIDCCYLIIYIRQTRLLRILSFLKEKLNYEKLNPLIIYFNLMHFMSKTTFTMSMDTKIKFS